MITGANKGLGLAVAEMLAEAKANVALVARHEESLQQIAEKLKADGHTADHFAFDLTNTRDMPDLFQRIHQTFGKIDVLINNAGTNIPVKAEEVTEEQWDQIHDINLKSVFFASQAAGKYMMEQKQGKIINMSSQMAFVGYYKRAAYSSSKGGITQLTKSLAVEWASYHINVNAVAPTFIETPMTAKMFEDPEFRREVLGNIPLGRLAREEDIFGAVLLLASSASDMITGHTLRVDGGWTVW